MLHSGTVRTLFFGVLLLVQSLLSTHTVDGSCGLRCRAHPVRHLVELFVEESAYTSRVIAALAWPSIR
jgi:hypothetical protein